LAQVEKGLVTCQERSEAADAQLRATCERLQQQLVPLTPLDMLVNKDILLDLIPRKADQVALDVRPLDLYSPLSCPERLMLEISGGSGGSCRRSD
jgi:hypothetical protein